MLADRFMHTVPGAWPAPAAQAPGALSAAAFLRAVCAPANLVLAAAIVAGWLALIAWTGAGPDSWQARTCAGLDGSVPACGALRAPKDPVKDPSRVAPHLAGARVAS
ncbi:hypothetical protein Q8W71_03865 [Methylobacterium sp. NEAU 140]|uniref:hypothetical protein n=1 Tax=Methylobacterium sp. NEAU 140 TaxID=3064945 RepID=UPI002734A05E|nr:hypothetical protein [Methylobacterium sp. NEAU 140]MDP4021752.1 hypothetical protein [Methylobacterium sp. NEAU 140]